jgi:TonB family protein
MMEFLIYDLKVAVLVAAFYMFYRLLLSHETFHRTNRLVLLATAIASFILPLCVITLHKTVVVSGHGLVSLEGLGMAEVADAAEPQMPLWQIVAIVVFFAGLAVTLGHTFMGILKVWRLVSHSERHQEPDGIVVCVTDRDVSPFSFCRYIVLSRSDYEAHEASVLAHERGHIRQRHSLDVLLVDTLTALQWFNPAMWMLRQDLRAIHEYEADAAVLSQGINMRQYQYLLIQKAVATCGYSVANGITHSTLKNRIHMMLTNKKTNRASWLKLLAMLPIVGAALALNAETVNHYVYEDTQEQPQKKVVKKGRKASQVKVNAKTIEVKTDKDVVTGENVTVELNADKQKSTGKKLVFLDEVLEGPEPLIVIDGKVATVEQLKALDQEEIDNITVLKKAKEPLEVYAKHFNADTSNGILFINTKEYVKNGKKEVVDVAVKKSDEEAEPEGAFDVVEQMPEFPGGAAGMMKFIAENVKYPEEAYSKGIEGRVLVQFIIEKDGSVTNVKVIKKVNDAIDAEAVRVVKAMPKWKPGKQNGREVRVKYTIPVSFRLS